MRIFEIDLPKTPEQKSLDQLRAISKRASNAVKAERNRQQKQRAQKAIRSIKPIKTFV